MIELTVALPVWNSKKILWLALESLCEQKQVDFKWELLIAEEQIEEFGQDAVSEYAERLCKAGCDLLRYFALPHHIPLPQKWKLLSEKTSSTSKVFLLQAADCYSEPLRLRRTLDKAREGYDWIQNRLGYYYSFHYQMLLYFDQKTFGPGCLTGLNMAVSTALIKSLPESWQDKGIDHWLYRNAKPKRVCWIEDDILGGVDTDDLNNISLDRRFYYHHPKPPFVATERTLEDIMPGVIAERIRKTGSRWEKGVINAETAH